MTEGGTHITVGLTTEACVSDSNADVPLGICSIPDVSLSLEKLRDRLKTSLPALPERFQFITERGWPVLESQESEIHLTYILSKRLHVRIKTTYDKPRIGVKTVQGSTLGFVFIEFSASLQSLRNAISDQLGNYIPGFGETSPRYQFLDLNKWPISYSQEQYFAVLEVVRESCVHIFTAGLPRLLSRGDSLDRVDSAYSTSERLDLVPMSVCASRPRPVTRQLTFRKVKDVERVVSTDNQVRNQVLISYVRAEAANHALKLKTQLTNHGYSVYLDVHEIQSGEDWQDALNSAVTTCEAFVPLVTSRYGETMWTNREVKLADVLSKPIIPVSFLNNWPPRCLAIQFATTQFVYWKPKCDVKLDTECESLDISHWHDDDVTAVVNHIAKRLKQDDIEAPSHGPTSQLKKNPTLRSCPAKLPVGYQLLSQNREGRPLVVISVHPQQKEFALKMQGFLEEEGHEVWCSIQDQLESHDSDSQGFSQEGHTRHFERSLSESSAVLGWSQCSQTSEDLEGNLKFQEKADEAGVVIVVLSKAYAQSKRCKQQVFYCEHRKKIVPVKYEDFCMPGWMSLLIGTGVLQDASCENFEELLKISVKKSINDELENDKEKQCTKTAAAAAALKRELPLGTYVYISGGTKFYHKETENICKALGEALAELDDIHVATGGFYGVGATVGQSYDAARSRMSKPCHLWHILPTKDDQDRSQQAPQNKNRSFRKVLFGRTLFSGDSVRERESIVSQVFPICVLIEGGPGAAHEAEEFVWNDGVVIPVECTGGAASGKFNVPDEIFELPVGVPVKDWYNLRNMLAGPQALAKSIANIVDVLVKRLKQCRAMSGYFRSQSCPSPPADCPAGLLECPDDIQKFARSLENDLLSYESSEEINVEVKVEKTDENPETPPVVKVLESSRKYHESAASKYPIVTARQATLDLSGIGSDNSQGFDMAVAVNSQRTKCLTRDAKRHPASEDKNWFTNLKSSTVSNSVVKNESPKKRKTTLPPLPRLTSGGHRNTTPVKLSNTKTLPAKLAYKNGSAKRTRQNVKSSAECSSSQQQNIFQASKKLRGSLE